MPAGLFLSSFHLCQFEVDVLLDGMRVGADGAAAIDEDGRGAADFEEIAVGDASVHFAGGLGRGQAGFKGVLIQAGLPSEVDDFVVDIRG